MAGEVISHREPILQSAKNVMLCCTELKLVDSTASGFNLITIIVLKGFSKKICLSMFSALTEKDQVSFYLKIKIPQIGVSFAKSLPLVAKFEDTVL